jgi:hypothetical protein
MNDPTYQLHESLIRLAKGMVKAWEIWLRASSGSVELPRPTDRRLDVMNKR